MRGDLDIEEMRYGLRQAFSDLRRLKKAARGAKGLYMLQLEDSIQAQRRVVISLFRAYNRRRRKCRN